MLPQKKNRSLSHYNSDSQSVDHGTDGPKEEIYNKSFFQVTGFKYDILYSTFWLFFKLVHFIISGNNLSWIKDVKQQK